MATPEEQIPPKSLSQLSDQVAAFSLTVYVAHREGQTHVRAANLNGFACTAAGERAALQQLLPKVKAHVAECVASGATIEWLDPPADRQDDEQQRVIPFHL